MIPQKINCIFIVQNDAKIITKKEGIIDTSTGIVNLSEDVSNEELFIQGTKFYIKINGFMNFIDVEKLSPSTFEIKFKNILEMWKEENNKEPFYIFDIFTKIKKYFNG